VIKLSRFSGWTIKDVEKLNKPFKVVEIPKLKKSNSGKDYVGMISTALTALGIKHELEYKFLHDRRFKFDIALPVHHIAIEFEGGIFTGGRHVRGTGYASDVKKYNLATMHGWKLLRYTSEDAKTLNWQFKIAEEIQQLIEKRG